LNLNVELHTDLSGAFMIGRTVLLLAAGWSVFEHGIWGRILGVICVSLALPGPALLSMVNLYTSPEAREGSLSPFRQRWLPQNPEFATSPTWWRKPLQVGPLASLGIGAGVGFLGGTIVWGYYGDFSPLALAGLGTVFALMGGGGSASTWIGSSNLRTLEAFRATWLFLSFTAFAILFAVGFWHAVAEQFSPGLVLVLFGLLSGVVSALLAIPWVLAIGISSLREERAAGEATAPAFQN
jgi:hypothetical protein